MKRSIVLCLALVLCASCIPPEPDDDVIVDWDPEETVMGEIQQAGELVVGIEGDNAPYGFFDTSGDPSGFTVEFGRLIADALGVEVRFVEADRLSLLTMPDEQKADLTFPMLSITEKRVRQFIITDPIYVALQRLLTEDPSIQGTDDLTGKIVCAADVDHATGLDVAEVSKPAKVVAPGDPHLCGSLIKSGKPGADVATGPDPVLIGITQQYEGSGFQIVGDELTTEAYGAVIEKGASAWQDFVNGVLLEADSEGDWQRFHDEWFGAGEEPVPYPDMTVEEAAALFPNDV